MSEHDDRHDDEADPRVSRAYREWSDERTPAVLDRQVLKQAAGEVGGTRASPSAWFRPVAFAATLVLGVALLFEMQTDPETGAPGTLPDSAGKPAPEGEAATAGEGAREAREEAVSRQRLRPDRESPRPPAGDTGTALSAGSPQSQKLEEEAPPARRAAARDEPGDCPADQAADADAWWRCIEALREAGATAAADRETERFRQRFPDYLPKR